MNDLTKSAMRWLDLQDCRTALEQAKSLAEMRLQRGDHWRKEARLRGQWAERYRKALAECVLMEQAEDHVAAFNRARALLQEDEK